jgi:hypothetical protein
MVGIVALIGVIAAIGLRILAVSDLYNSSDNDSVSDEEYLKES